MRGDAARLGGVLCSDGHPNMGEDCATGEGGGEGEGKRRASGTGREGEGVVDTDERRGGLVRTRDGVGFEDCEDMREERRRRAYSC